MGSSDILRRRGTDDRGEVSFAELFYDLVYVFTIIQLSITIAANYTLRGAAEGAVLVLAIWWLWIFTTWALNWLHPEKTQVRIMLFAMMFAGLVLATAIPDAWGEGGLLFACVFSAMQVGRSIFTAFAFRGVDAAHRRNFTRIAIWTAVSGGFWIAGGFAAPETRLLYWLAALAIEYSAPAVFFWVPGMGRSTTADWDVSGAHMAERCALFVLICLGETILASGRTMAAVEADAKTIGAFAAAFAITCLMWWLYFRFGQDSAAHTIEESPDPGRVARAVFTYAHIPIVAGVILSAVATEFALAHPGERAGFREASAILGGPALFVAGNLWVKWQSSRRPPVSHLVGLALFAGLAAASSQLETWELKSCAGAVLMVVALWEFISLKKLRPDTA